MRIEKDGQVIRSIADWKLYAPPKDPDRQWVEERSAYELARAWCGDGEPAMPTTLRSLLDSRPETAGLQVDCVYPEHHIRFDDYRGEVRNADLAFLGRTGDRTVAVTIEAKADEPYGATVANTICDGLERRIRNPRSRGVERMRDVVASLFPVWVEGLPHVGELYYQLLTAVAGTLAFATENHADAAVLIIHEFVTVETTDSLHALNAKAYEAFLHRLCGHPIAAGDLRGLLGPLSVPGGPRFSQPPPIFIGKLVSNRRAMAAAGACR